MDSKAECDQLNLAHVAGNKKYTKKLKQTNASAHLLLHLDHTATVYKTHTTLTIGLTTVATVSSVRDLYIFVDFDLVMRVFQSLVAALVLSQLDCGNGTLVGLSAYLVRRL